MKIKEVIIRHLKMDLVTPFQTSFMTEYDRDFLLLEVKDESGVIGFGESVAMRDPLYNEETCQTNWHILEEYLIPMLLNKELNHPDEVSEIFKPIKRNNMAKSAIEGAVWDIYCQLTNQSLKEAIGGTQDKIEVGVSIGIQPTSEQLVETVAQYVDEGYKRIKIKIKPGFDLEPLRAVRKQFPHIPLMADANSAYSLEDLDHLKQLDELDLMMIEQPLASDDIVDHRKLQEAMETPICLDESILSLEDTRKAIELGSTKIINIKIGRVGGIIEAIKIHDYCKEHEIPVWCGGMLESGIGRAHNIALTSLSNFTLPGDTSSSARYWKKDIISPEVVMEDGYIHVPNEVGIGYEIDRDAVNQYTIKEKVYRA